MIRPATPADAVQLAGVQHRAWHRAYADLVDPGHFGSLEERVARWEELLGAPPERGCTALVSEVARRIAGFAAVGPARDDDAGPPAGELVALYVDPPAQGAGVGGALLRAAEALLRERGFAHAVLWVLSADEHARHVYERRGWSLEAGSERAGAWAPEVRYRRAL